MRIVMLTGPTTLLTLIVVLSLAGCKKDEYSGAGENTTRVVDSDPGRLIGPASSPVEPTLDQGWCGGHGVPESVLYPM